jgi:hypothetical protein
MPEPIIRLTRASGNPLLCILSHFHSVQTSNGETIVRMVAQSGELMNVQVRESESEVRQRVDAAKAKAADTEIQRHAWFEQTEN